MQEVSVIIPNYNGIAYLEGVLASLEQQTMDNAVAANRGKITSADGEILAMMKRGLSDVD